jgi:hypothetical protein
LEKCRDSSASPFLRALIAARASLVGGCFFIVV